MKKLILFLVCIATLLSLTACSVTEFLAGLFGGEAAYVRCDKDGTPNAEGDYVLFGEYPQSLKSDDVAITASAVAEDGRGYCLGSDGCYYAKVVADPYSGEYTFADGSAVTEGETYYFKVEPIRWRIISENSESAMLLCDSIIDHSAYQSAATKSGESYYVDGAPDGTYANNYEYSEIRAWLNGTFFETAFTKLQQQIILETDVNNRAASAGSPSSPYVCENTQDFVFLLSYEDIKTEAYGFTAAADEKDPCRALLTSDYARATGTLMKTVDGYYGNGTWWLRSASASGYTNSAYRIDTFGKVDKGYVNNVQYGVVPALIIKL